LHSKGQEDNVALAFKNGLVGAEVVLDGTVWAIVREIGMAKRNVAVPGGDLDALAAGAERAHGSRGFHRRRSETAVLSKDIACAHAWGTRAQGMAACTRLAGPRSGVSL
jgi:hypothetical protein